MSGMASKNKMALILCLVIGLSRCSSLLLENANARTVRCKVVVSPEFAENTKWRQNVETLVEYADRVMYSWADIHLHIDTMTVFDVESSSSYAGHFFHDCLIKEIPKGSSDIVLYFSRHRTPQGRHVGMSKFEFGYLHVVQLDWDQKNRDYMFACHTLLHELGHMFGAVHVYRLEQGPRMMNPYLEERLVQKKGMAWEYKEPEFNLTNAKIMAACAHRGFRPREWSDSTWRTIRDAYARIPEMHNKWRFSSDGKILSHEFNEFVEGQRFAFLATWASLSGHHDLALKYLDTLEWFEECAHATCLAETGSVSRLCRRRGGHNRSEIDSYAFSTHAWIQLRKAYVFLRAGKVHEADSCRKLFTDALVGDYDSQVRGKYLNQYKLYKSIYVPEVSTSKNGGGR
ncbi:MAG: hypothetical protein GF344_05215 [Chitinivibrionales bacterium]|nr:hypothetical protein [Chitinivibrionales bacterium]MBD3356397.1 hypothetical protein [Chitinivibrionales bacterium]